MAASYKICPRCKSAAPRTARQCETCGKRLGSGLWSWPRAKRRVIENYDAPVEPQEIFESAPFPLIALLLLLLLIPLALLAARASSASTGREATILFVVAAVALLVYTTPGARAWLEKRLRKK